MPATPRNYQTALVVILTALLVITFINPLYLHDQLLNDAPMLIATPILFVAARREWLSSRAMTCLFVFWVLHVIGGRYTYSNTPYGESLSFLALGDETTSRNHYDRLVHLAFGMLAMQPVVEIAQRYGGQNRAWARLLAFSVVAAASCLYEVLEWLLTIVAAPDAAETYNGQQGDPWDAQKDMALALIGQVLVLPFVGHKPKK